MFIISKARQRLLSSFVLLWGAGAVYIVFGVLLSLSVRFSLHPAIALPKESEKLLKAPLSNFLYGGGDSSSASNAEFIAHVWPGYSFSVGFLVLIISAYPVFSTWRNYEKRVNLLLLINKTLATTPKLQMVGDRITFTHLYETSVVKKIGDSRYYLNVPAYFGMGTKKWLSEVAITEESFVSSHGASIPTMSIVAEALLEAKKHSMKRSSALRH